MVLVALRHAQSIFNVLKRSRPDCSLSAEGIRQAKLLQGEFCHVVCSPLRRAKQTLETSSITYKSIEYEELAREKKDDVCDFLPSEPNERETLLAFATRMHKLDARLQSLELAHTNVLLVAHAYVILALQRMRKGLSLPTDTEDLAHIASSYSDDHVPNAQFLVIPSSREPSFTRYHASSSNSGNGKGEGSVVS